MRYPAIVVSALLLAGASFAATARVETTTVGADSSCDFHSLDRAIEAIAFSPGQHRIRLARNIKHVLTNPDQIAHDVQLVGGYSNCADETALGYTAVTVQHTPPPELMANVDGVRFETDAHLSLAQHAAP